MKFIKDLFRWFFKRDNQPIKLDSEQSESTHDSSSQDVDDPYSIYTKESILNDMRNLATATKRFDQAKENLIKELKNIGPRHFRK